MPKSGRVISLTTRLHRWANQWGLRWKLPGLKDRIIVEFSPRMRVSLGRSYPQRGLVRLHPSVETDDALLREVLCHEVAHVAVFELHGTKCQPHGPEWQALVRAAGFEPHVRCKHVGSQAAQKLGGRIAPFFEHRCPVCQAVRHARRRVSRWRCAACVAAGLDGEMCITQIKAPR